MADMFNRLQKACLDLSNVTLKCCALGADEESVNIAVSQEHGGVSNSLINRVEDATCNGGACVTIYRGDYIVIQIICRFLV